ncbi:MAG TPA: glycerate-2-kinase family protein, partial [Burkholderiales bacterium]|nr:glycerate-2-kinase family protein [Burkholderiales bacterium]
MTTTVLRRHALSIFRAALTAADPAAGVTRHLQRLDFSRFENVYVVGAGKAGASMAAAAERVIGRRITAGFVNVKEAPRTRLRRIDLHESGHPVPDARGTEGAQRIAQIAESAGRRDLVVCLISGGASALMPLPAPPITLEEKQATTRLLLACGADIHEINTLRKHISAIKGGQLARLAAPARVEALLLSDVIGDDPSAIGSGPAAPDATTFADALGVLDRYGIRDRAPASVRVRL